MVPTLRCTTHSNNLEDLNAIAQSHKHTQLLLDMFDDDLKELWDGYGVIGNVVVC